MSTIASVLAGESKWVVVEGKCERLLKSLPDKSVSHIITDPPYEVEAHTKGRRTLKDATQKRGAVNRGEVRMVDVVLPFGAITPALRNAFSAQASRVAQRWVVAFCQIEAIGEWKRSLVAGGNEWVRGGIWRKPDGCPQFTGDRPGQGFESIAIAHSPGKKKWNGGGKHAVWTVPLDHAHGAGGKAEHPTIKPTQLMLELIEDFTDPGDVVLDPFCGSGSTLVAAIRLGRRAIGFEMNEAYAAYARERCVAEERVSTVQAVRAKQASLFELTGTR